jgi:alpha-glucoside transport system substrate-binding protein
VKKLSKLLAAVLALALLAAACGGSDGSTASVDTSAVDDALAEAEAARAEADEAKAAADEAAAAIAEAEEAKAAAEAAKAEAEDAAAASAAEAEEAKAAAEAASDSGPSNPLAGTAVRVTGPERSPNEAGALQAALNEFADANDMTIFYVGSADWEAEINVQIEAGNPPDISIFPQPGKLADFARSEFVLPLPEDVLASVGSNWNDAAMGFGLVDGTQFGVPNKSDLKSLVWYQPARFEANGYAIPNTLDELFALADQMIADGNTPFCVGIESGQATGWAFTDWVEDMMLRTYSPEQYDAWVAGDLLFSSDEVSGVMQTVLDVWNTPGMVYADGGTIASTAFQANGEPLVNGDCMMHRQASFFSAFFPEGTPAADGSEGAIDVFYFPEGSTGRPVLGAGTLAGAFNDNAATWAVMEYLGSAEFANARQAAQKAANGGEGFLSGFNTANLNVDRSLWEPLEQSFQTILAEAEVLRFDGSDLMPADVGAGTFWTEGTAMVNGDKTVAEAAAAIDASWPSE